jgi:hypothetical protein
MTYLLTSGIAPSGDYGGWSAIAYLPGQRAPSGKESLC